MLLDVFQALTLAGTLTGFGFTVHQIRCASKQIRTSFEDALTKEYRELCHSIPTKALLGEELSDEELAHSFDEMYRYFDLCNHQAFLAKSKRIAPETWEFWKDGITSNMKRPAFEKAWSEIAARSGEDFSELRAIVPPIIKKQNDAK